MPTPAVSTLSIPEVPCLEQFGSCLSGFVTSAGSSFLCVAQDCHDSTLVGSVWQNWAPAEGVKGLWSQKQQRLKLSGSSRKKERVPLGENRVKRGQLENAPPAAAMTIQGHQRVRNFSFSVATLRKLCLSQISGRRFVIKKRCSKCW